MPRGGPPASAAQAVLRKQKAVQEERQAKARGTTAARSRASVLPTPQRTASLKRAWQKAKEVVEGGTFVAKKTRRFKVDTGREPTELDAAVSAALRLHSELLPLFADDSDRGADLEWTDACEMAERRTSELYQELLDLFRILLKASSVDREAEECAVQCSYSVAEIHGRSFESPAGGAQLPMSERLARLRSESSEGMARDALAVVLALLSSRKEMCWLEAYHEEAPVRGYFAHALANAHSMLRISMSNSLWGPRPAGLLVTSRQPLRLALENTDSGGPLKNMPREIWLGSAACETVEFALQELEDADDLGALGSLTEERALLRTLVPDTKLRSLLLSQANVIAVEAYASLAPRSIASAEGLGEVVRHEFLTCLQKSKVDGSAVLLQLGGSNPHLLARKVYLKPAFKELGLRCGYLRWRLGPDSKWASEQPAADRACLGFLLP